MRTRNAMQLKAVIRNKAKEEGVPPQFVMQNYLLERLLERISLSAWRDSVVIKGGMLISSLVGVDKRSTKDLDTTVRGFPLTHENAERAFREIAAVEADDDFAFKFVRTEDIRETDDYPGIRVHLLANYEKMNSSVTVDVTTGDRITPDAIEYSYPLMFDDRTLSLMAYPLATTLAEKLETVISRGVANTRSRDYYDLHTLWLTRKSEVDLSVIGDALAATSEKRGTRAAMGRYREVMTEAALDAAMLDRWMAYVRRYPYVGDRRFRRRAGRSWRSWRPSAGRARLQARDGLWWTLPGKTAQAKIEGLLQQYYKREELKVTQPVKTSDAEHPWL